MEGATTAPFGMRQPRRRKLDLLPYFFLAPIATLLILVSFYPAAYAVWLGMTDATLLKIGKENFIGLGNFVRMMNDRIFSTASGARCAGTRGRLSRTRDRAADRAVPQS